MPKRERVIENRGVGNSVFVDTSAWVALFSGRDQNHKDADHSFRQLLAAKRRLLTTNLVLAELHRLLLHRAGIRAAEAALDKIEASPLVRIDYPGEAAHKSAKAWIRELYKHQISYTDAVSFAVMEASRCTAALTFDHHFHLAGFS